MNWQAIENKNILYLWRKCFVAKRVPSIEISMKVLVFFSNLCEVSLGMKMIDGLETIFNLKLPKWKNQTNFRVASQLPQKTRSSGHYSSSKKSVTQNRSKKAKKEKFEHSIQNF